MRDEGVELRPLEDSDLPLLAAWRRADHAREAFFSVEPVSTSGQAAWYARYMADPADQMFVIIEPTGRSVGTISLSRIDYRNQKAELGRVLIGDPSDFGRGLAFDACRVLLQYATEDLHLRKIYLEVLADNQAAVCLYKKLGFETEGVLRSEVFARGSWHDVLHMARLGAFEG